MIAFFKKSTLQIILMTALLCFQTGVSSQIPIPDTSYLQELDPNTGAVSIQQVTFVFDSGRLLDSDWGQFQIDPAKWKDSTDMSSGYLNFFIMGTSILERKWVVRNLYVPSAIIDDCPPPEIEDSAISPNEPSSSVPNPAPIDFDPVITSNPLSTYFDLRPNTEASGRLDNIQGIILVSKQPLPVLSDILNAASTFPVHTISIEQIVVNAEGYRWVSIFLQSTITGDSDINMIGPPPNPPDPGSGLPGDLEFPIEVFQSDQPNVSCAENQCVPMAHANVFAYLQDRYDGIPLVWNLPHDSVHGIGKVTSAGDVFTGYRNLRTVWLPM